VDRLTNTSSTNSANQLCEADRLTNSPPTNSTRRIGWPALHRPTPRTSCPPTNSTRRIAWPALHRPTLRGGPTDQLYADQLCWLTLHRPTHRQATRWGRDLSPALLTHNSYDGMCHHQATSRHAHNTSRGRQSVLVNMIVHQHVRSLAYPICLVGIVNLSHGVPQHRSLYSNLRFGKDRAIHHTGGREMCP
jgi:hypothetical protein